MIELLLPLKSLAIVWRGVWELSLPASSTETQRCDDGVVSAPSQWAYSQPERCKGERGEKRRGGKEQRGEERSKTTRKWSGKWRCWGSNYDGGAGLWQYCRPILSAIRLPFLIVLNTLISLERFFITILAPCSTDGLRCNLTETKVMNRLSDRGRIEQ